MNRKLRRTLAMIVGILTVALTPALAPAQQYGMGDLGKPDDYELTMKVFRDRVTDFASFVDQLPASFNWKAQGKVTPAKDQQSCGSCWAFASVGALESKLLMKGKPAYNLSEQQQISCNTTMYGCSGGSSSSLRFWETLGPMREGCTDYPSRDGSEPACSTLGSCARLPYRTLNYYTVDTSSPDEVKTSLYTDGPTYFRFDVYSDFYSFWGSASSGAVYTQSSGYYQGGHAVLLIGWSDSKGAWLLKNSWGKNAGPNGDGTFWMAYSGHAEYLYFGMANVEIKEVKAPLKRKKLMFLRRALSDGPFGIQIFNPPTEIGGDIGAVLASDNHIGSNALDVAAGNYGIGAGDELILLTNDTATAPNKLFLYNMPTVPNGNTGAAFAGDNNIGKKFRYVTSGDFNGDGKEEVAAVRKNPTTKLFELYIYTMPATVGGEVTLIASDMNIGANILGIAAGNHNTDLNDELFVIAGNATRAGLYIYKAPTGIKGDTGNPIASDADIGAGVISRGLAAGNFDGNASDIEVAILRRLSTGGRKLEIFNAPTKVNGSVGNAIAGDNSIHSTILGVSAVHFVDSSTSLTEDVNDEKARNGVE
jgi:hypothetical protein